MIRSLLLLLALVLSTAHAQTTLLPTTVSGGTGAVANIQQNDATSLSIGRGQTSTIGGFGSFAGTINSVYLMVEYTPASNYAGTAAVKVNGISTPIIPNAADRTRSAFIDITAGSYGIDTSAEINSLSVSFQNTGSGSSGAIVFDYVYLVINPTLPIHMPHTWSDEFEGSGPPDSTKWGLEQGYQRNNELQYYMTSGNAWREGGNMIIEARREPMNGYAYTSASLITSGKYSWKYGRAQIRAKIPALVGMWPAIWQVGVSGEWPSNGECDILEFYQEKILANCAIGTSTRWTAEWFTATKSMTSLEAVDPNWRTNWHVWTMQWDEDNVRLYCDNNLLNTVPQTSLINPNGFEPFKQPHSIWLNLAVGGAGGDPSATSFPQRYFIDYWRIWEGYTQNSAPTDIALSSYEVGEDLPAGTIVGNLSVTDPDPAEVIKYTLVTGTGSTHNSQFTIPAFASDSTNTLVLKTNTPLNYADGATRSIRVRATDIEGAFFDKILTIQVQQNIAVSRNAFVIPEGSTNTFQVKLLRQPASTVTLNVQRTSGDPNLSVQSGATLTFTPQNYAIWQTVTIYAAVGPLTNNGVATFTCSDAANVYGTQTIAVTKVLQSNQVPTVDAGTPQSLVLDPAATLPAATAGSSIFLDANLDNGANTTWEDTLLKWSPTLDTNVTFLADAGSSLKGITAAYEFPGNLSGNGGGSGPPLESISPRADLSPISVELWFKPDASATYPTHGQILWETGGDPGFGIFYRNGAIRASHDANQGLMSVDVSQLTHEFIHVVVTYNTASSTDNYKMYVNGELRASQSRSDGDLSGTDAAGLGKMGGTKAGGAGSAATTSFDGKIAKFRSYHNRILTAAEVFANYRAVVPTVSATLTGTVTDPELQPVSGSWSVVSGPGPVVFLNPNALNTSAGFSTSGTYVLRLLGSDGIYEIQDDVTITITSPAVTRSVTYNGNGSNGGSAPVDSNLYASGSTVTVLGAGTLTKTGHTFAGWNTAANGSGTAYAAGATFTINANTTLYAQWSPSTYTVTFNGNNGTSPSPATKQVTYGSAYGTLATTTRAGYSFNGWFTAASGGSLVTEATSVTNASDHQLHAQWTLIPVSVIASSSTVQVPEGGTAAFQVKLSNLPSGNVTVTVARSSGDSNISISSSGILTFTTSNWDTFQDITLAAANDADAANGSATITCTPSDGNYAVANITATETDKDTTLTVTDDGNGSTTPATSVVVQKNTATAISATANVGYNFLNWMVTSGSAIFGNADSPSTTVTINQPTTIRANFTIREYTLTYSAGTGGTISGDALQTVNHGTSGTAVSAIASPGYTFSKWSDNVTTASRTDTAVTGNINVTAEFSANTYTVTFDANGGSAADPASKSVTFDSPYGILPTSTRSGYSLDSWFTALTGGERISAGSNVAIANNHTLYALWRPDTYVVSYDGNGNTGGTAPANQDKLHDINLALATNSGGLSKTGFSFTGWNTAADGTGTDYPEGSNYSGNTPLTLYAKWAPGNSNTWDTDAAGNWTDVQNWAENTNYAGGADNTATLGNFITTDRIITLDAPITIGNITASDTTHNYTVSGANTLTLDRTTGLPTIDVTSGRTLTISSNIAGTNGLNKTGAGTLMLGGINSFNGLTLAGGTVQLGVAADSLGAADSAITVTASSTLNFGTSTGNLTFDKSLQVNDGTILTTVRSVNYTNTITGIVSGSGTISVNDSGTLDQRALILSNANNTFTGTVDLATKNKSSLRVASIGDASGAGNILLGRGNENAFILDTTAVAALALNHRRIEIASGGAASNFVNIYNNNTTAANTLSINTDLLVNSTGGTKTIALGGVNTGANTFAGKIGDANGTVISITKNDAGTWVLGNTGNTYTGVTTITAGTLQVSKLADGGATAGSSIGKSSNAASNLVFHHGARLLYVGSGDSTDRLFTFNGFQNDRGFTIESSGTGALRFTNTGAITFTNRTDQRRFLNLDGSNTDDNTFTGQIVNNVTGLDLQTSVNKFGLGKWVLTGSNTYTGATTISLGKLFINGDQTNATGNVSVATNATLGGTGIIGGNTTISSNGRLEFDLSTNATTHDKLEIASGKTLSFSGASTLTITSSGGASTGSYVLISAPGGLTVTTLPTLVLPSGWSGTVSKVGTDLVLNLTTILTPFQQWAVTNALTDGNAASDADPDGDGWTNLKEFAFGTSPNAGLTGSLAFTLNGEVTKTGSPLLRDYTPPQGSPPFQAVFGRRKNHVAAGITYTAEFSANLTYWTPSSTGLSILTGEGSHDIEVVAVPFPENVPLSLGGTQAPPKFFRIRLATTP